MEQISRIGQNQSQVSKSSKDECICVNCGQPFPSSPSVDPAAWLAEITGRNLPTETVSWMHRYAEEQARKCRSCRDLEYRQHKEEQVRATFLAEVAEQKERWHAHCGVERKYLHTTFSTFDIDFDGGAHQPVFQECFDYAQHYPIEKSLPIGYPSLVLYSEHSWGVGKTHLAAAIAHHIIDRWEGQGLHARGCPVWFYSEPEVFASIRASFNYTEGQRESRPSEETIMRRLIEAPLLILDDVGKEAVKDLTFVQRVLFAVIDGRDKRQLPVVMTANLDQAGLQEHMGNRDNQAAFDRLLGMCHGKLIQIDGASYRLQGGLGC